ncbi:MAG TPA: serine/threonine protein kinase, partial [Planctomycetaceae bacterium]|nr:serine/threonine protein kinase [Planctomycetaceae bacterium]
QAGHVQIGRYRVVEKVGAGGMGAVYRAIHVDLQREVALKILPSAMAKNPTMVARFKREARAAAKLQHENIVQIFDVSEEGGRYLLAMEFVRGRDLADIIAQRKIIPVREAVQYLIQAARALDHAHRQGLVHRDIKPSNFIITPEGKLKLCDMGLAVPVDVEEESRVTRDGTTVGTVDYMSPEQAQDSRAVDTRSDIYSLGCTFYHMLTGHVPFEGNSIPEKLFKHAREDPPDPLQYNPNIPGEVLYIMSKMMAKRPEDRYQSPRELLDDLENLDLDELQADEQASFQKTLQIGLEAVDTGEADSGMISRGSSAVLRRRPEPESERKWQLQGKLIIGIAA